MDSGSHYQQRPLSCISFPHGTIDGPTDDTSMSSSELMPGNQILGYSCLDPAVAMYGPFASSESFQGGRRSSSNHLPSQDDLSLTLGLACASKRVAGGLSLSSGEVVTENAHAEGGGKSQVNVDLGLGLTYSGSSHMKLARSSSMRLCVDSETREGWQDKHLEAYQHQCHFECSNSGGITVKSISNLNANSRLEMDLRLGLGGSSYSLESDCLSDVPIDTSEPRVDLSAFGHVPVIDEGSSSARFIKPGGYMSSLLQCTPPVVGSSNGSTEMRSFNMFVNTQEVEGLTHGRTDAPADTPENSHMHPAPTLNSTTNVGSERPTKTCKFKGCCKGARGASGLCIAHGGGRRCQRANCNKGAEGRTMFCKAHGGGQRCQSLGCIKSAEGRTDFCIAHGGGRRCSYDGCSKAARGKSGLCIRHGGGKRCQKDGCTKSAEGFSGLCISHGGGRRCQYPNCGKGAQGSTKFCKTHGGGKRCEFEGCSKGAEGSTSFCKGHGGGKRCSFRGGMCMKSVHGGTAFCVAHGGGKRCTIPGCTKSARGKTDFCVRHGGGKRCKFEDCSKSAQGRTDFCKAHGGGKRCVWGQEGSTYNGSILSDEAPEGLRGSCDKFARGKTGFCSAHNALLEHFHHPFGDSLTATSSASLFCTHQSLQPHSDLSEQTLQLDNEQFCDTQSQLACREGPSRPEITSPSQEYMTLQLQFSEIPSPHMLRSSQKTMPAASSPRLSMDTLQFSCPPGFLYGTLHDPEERVHGGGHFMTLLDSKDSSTRGQGEFF